MKYETEFNLTHSIKAKDYIDVQEYLQEDNMTKYLKNDLESTRNKEKFPSLSEKIDSIIWNLNTTTSGVITLYTHQKLTKEELNFISEWVSGQNSDGLGEGFSGQDFAYLDENTNISFDWRTNNYVFTDISN